MVVELVQKIAVGGGCVARGPNSDAIALWGRNQRHAAQQEHKDQLTSEWDSESESESGRRPGPGAEQGQRQHWREGEKQARAAHASVTGQQQPVSYRTCLVLSAWGVAATSCRMLGCAEVWVRADGLLCVVRVSSQRWVQHGSDGGLTKAEHHSRRLWSAGAYGIVTYTPHTHLTRFPSRATGQAAAVSGVERLTAWVAGLVVVLMPAARGCKARSSGLAAADPFWNLHADPIFRAERHRELPSVHSVAEFRRPSGFLPRPLNGTGCAQAEQPTLPQKSNQSTPARISLGVVASHPACELVSGPRSFCTLL
ncbi:hypothetical protein PVAR5_3906 [Paecilomyces variotii No. 5]|uniref:Uncharacterized protein n=1 Tax=Byssochlamys spectabilis (strain No. 5 / NBRC 109023) TaxID=1356009 RepID=V5HZ18_BYSSN|nr:hypothetical protein PVAR5_3906 [Paecilomyces variotii No. 5]